MRSARKESVLIVSYNKFNPGCADGFLAVLR